MPQDDLTTPALPPADNLSGRGIVPAARRGLDAFDDEGWGEEPPERPGGQGLNLRRYVSAVWRRKWLLAVALVVGAAGAAGAYTFLGVRYTALGTIWVRGGGGQGNVGPIAQGQLLQQSSWTDLLKSFAVLDTVAASQRLYLSVPAAYAPAFTSFSLADRFRPGSYVLDVAADGRRFTLTSNAGATLQTGTLGDSIGAPLGFRWQPKASAFPAGTSVRFQVRSPRDAARILQDQLTSRMDPGGNFISLSLSGADPRKIASALNAVMDQYVAVAAQLNRSKLDAQLKILEDQLGATEQALRQAERDLQDFRVKTITLPSDASTPIAPGLQMTQTPVIARFFQMKVDLEQTRRDREQLQHALDSISQGTVRIESLEAVPEVGKSSELTQALGELVTLRAQLRTLRNNYTDDYPPIQDLLRQIATLEHQTIPAMARAVVNELRSRENVLSRMVDSASVQLAEIPPRTIEEGRLEGQVAIQQKLYDDLRGRVETAQLASAGAIPDVQILDRAAIPEVPTTDRRRRFAAMILLASFGAAIGLAILLDLTDRRIQRATDVDSTIGLQILGSIPRVEPVAGRRSGENAAQVVEAFRELRVTVSFAYGSAGPMVLAISSPAKGEGKTLVATNLAVAFAEMGRRTLLIDGDTRRGDAHRLLAVGRKPGLTDYLKDHAAADIVQKTTYEHLDFIPCGTRGTSTPELLASHRMAAFLGTLKRAYDVILVDCPPLAAGADALVLSGLAGNLAVVLRTGSTDKRLAVAKLETLSRLPIRILGAVLNDVEPKGEYYRYYASYLPGYRTRSEAEEEAEEGRRLLSATVETEPSDGD
jgi:succinoglycan biosynthesis transport protein ExoP